jgi:hypothetical protein
MMKVSMVTLLKRQIGWSEIRSKFGFNTISSSEDSRESKNNKNIEIEPSLFTKTQIVVDHFVKGTYGVFYLWRKQPQGPYGGPGSVG